MPKTDKMEAMVANNIPSQSPEEIVQAVNEMPADANVVHFAGREGGKNAFASFIATRTEAVQNKVKLVTDVKAQLKEAAKLASNADKADTAALEPAQKGGLLLFQGMTQGILSNDEVSDILGTTFGWKKKANNEQSATPAGLGEVIRKRVVRAFKAYDYAVAGNEPVAFFEPLERDDVEPFLNELNAGKRSLWGVYDGLAALKAEKTGKRPKAAFDPRRIAALTRDMGQSIPTTVGLVRKTPGLFAAYAGLLQMLTLIGNEIGNEPETNESEAEEVSEEISTAVNE